MRETALWACGAVLAFLITAGAFLSLANLATGSPEESLSPNPGNIPARPGPPLDLELNEDHLLALRPKPDQDLQLTLKNTGAEDYSDVNLELRVSSDDTAHPQTRYYRRAVTRLPAGETVPVGFNLDLSNTPPTTRSASAPAAEPRKIIEVRVATPEGVSAVRTAIVPM